MDRFHNLARRSRIAAYVLGRGSEYKFFYLHVENSDEEIRDCARRGLRVCGVIGLVRGRIETAVAESPEAARIMGSAREDFECALVQMSAPVN